MDVSSMEPMLPPEAERSLDDVTFELVREASMLAGLAHPLVQNVVGGLVRSMNCQFATTASHKSAFAPAFRLMLSNGGFPGYIRWA